MDQKPKTVSNVLSGTGGAVPVKNDKGEISMQKVKVMRYVAGKRPNYAPSSDNEEDDEKSSGASDDEETVKRPRTSRSTDQPSHSSNVEDRRLRRLQESTSNKESGESARDRLNRHRQIAEPEILEEQEEESDDDDNDDKPHGRSEVKDEPRDEVELDEDERIRRRMELKKKALQRQEEHMKVEEEQTQQATDESDDSDDESEYEEYSDSDEDAAPRLKPIFVRKSDRATIIEKEQEEENLKKLEAERERMQAESRKQTKKILADEIMREKLAEKENDDDIVCDFATDDETDETAYELWKLRELKRIKRDRDEKEAQEREKQELQKIRNMTEEERLAFLKANPKTIVNKSEKGKYKFMQKYYHRGVFFMDKEEEVFKRNYAEPTLEDHFDKSILPKVMQVKNFGMAGRTKYTHLLDQDTTRKDDDPWGAQEKFLQGKGGGTKQTFDKPTAKKRK